jgi:SAM-dependent methyltransferase
MICPACGGNAVRSSVARKGYWTVACGMCGLRSIDPIPDAEALAEYYSRHYVLAVDSHHVDGRRILAQADHLIRELKRYAPDARTLCEIGCSAGWLLNELRFRGYRVKGYELSVATSRLARDNFGLDVVTGEFTGDGECFDAILMRHVLEHTRDPLAQLVAAARRLKPGGTLFLAVPNGGGLASRVLGQYWSWYIPPAHIWYFTRPSLYCFLERVGLDSISITTRDGDAGTPCLELAVGLARCVRATITRTAASPDMRRLGSGLGSQTAFLNQRLRLALIRAAAVTFAPIGSIFARAGLADELWAVVKKPPANHSN